MGHLLIINCFEVMPQSIDTEYRVHGRHYVWVSENPLFSEFCHFGFDSYNMPFELIVIIFLKTFANIVFVLAHDGFRHSFQMQVYSLGIVKNTKTPSRFNHTRLG